MTDSPRVLKSLYAVRRSHQKMLLILNHIQYLSRSLDHRYHSESDHDLQSNLKGRGLLKS